MLSRCKGHFSFCDTCLNYIEMTDVVPEEEVRAVRQKAATIAIDPRDMRMTSWLIRFLKFLYKDKDGIIEGCRDEFFQSGQKTMGKNHCVEIASVASDILRGALRQLNGPDAMRTLKGQHVIEQLAFKIRLYNNEEAEELLRFYKTFSEKNPFERSVSVKHPISEPREGASQLAGRSRISDSASRAVATFFFYCLLATQRCVNNCRDAKLFGKDKESLKRNGLSRLMAQATEKTFIAKIWPRTDLLFRNHIRDNIGNPRARTAVVKSEMMSKVLQQKAGRKVKLRKGSRQAVQAGVMAALNAVGQELWESGLPKPHKAHDVYCSAKAVLGPAFFSRYMEKQRTEIVFEQAAAH